MTAGLRRDGGVRRADVAGYAFVLWGLTLLFDPSGSAFSNGLTAATVATVVLSVLMVGVGVHLFTAPEAYPGGRKPASTLLRVVAILLTALFAVLATDAAGAVW